MTLSTEAILAYSQAFVALMSGDYGNFRLWPCKVNGEPTLEIVALHEHDEKTIVAQPLFVAITESMVITHEKGRTGGGDESGPSREDVQSAGQELTSPHPGG